MTNIIKSIYKKNIIDTQPINETLINATFRVIYLNQPVY